MAIFCFDQRQSNGHIFRVKKSHISLRGVYFNTLHNIFFSQLTAYISPSESVEKF